MSATTNPSSFTATHTDRSVSGSLAARVGVLGYGIASYFIGVAALLVLIVSSLGVIDLGFGGFELSSTAGGIALNVAFLVAFALQHSIMARKRFKQIWTKIVPPAAERSTYLVATAILLVPMIAAWQPIADVTIWSVEAEVWRYAIYGVALLGWAYLFAASFAINHFELFGLQQVWNAFRGRETKPVPFTERWMYRFDRHPIMTGFALGMWAVPDMSLGRLIFTAGLTVYVLIGVYFEERALLREWGDDYRDYKNRVGSIVPSFH